LLVGLLKYPKVVCQEDTLVTLSGNWQPYLPTIIITFPLEYLSSYFKAFPQLFRLFKQLEFSGELVTFQRHRERTILVKIRTIPSSSYSWKLTSSLKYSSWNFEKENMRWKIMSQTWWSESWLSHWKCWWALISRVVCWAGESGNGNESDLDAPPHFAYWKFRSQRGCISTTPILASTSFPPSHFYGVIYELYLNDVRIAKSFDLE